MFAWPLASAVIGLGFAAVFDKRSPEQNYGWGRFLFSLITGIPVILLIAPVVYMLYIMLSLSLPVVQAVLTIFGLCLVTPLIGDLCTTTRRGLVMTAVVLLASVGCCAFAIKGATFNESRPRIDDVFYASDADSSKAWWMSFNPSSDDWIWQFFGPGTTKAPPDKFLPWIKSNMLRAVAPVSSLAPPLVEVKSDVPYSGVRTVTLHVTAQPGAGGTFLLVDDGVNLISATLAGHEMPDPDSAASRQAQSGPFRLFFVASPKEGFDIQICGRGSVLRTSYASDIHDQPEAGVYYAGADSWSQRLVACLQNLFF